MQRDLIIYVDKEKIIGTVHVPLYEKSDKCIVMCHGLLASRMSPKAVLLSTLLEKAGYYSLRFDFRGCGSSDGLLQDSVPSKRMDDLSSVLDHMEQQFDIRKIGLFGSSLGAYLSLLRAGTDPRVKVIVSVSSPHSMAELLEDEYLETGTCEIDGIRFGMNFLEDSRRWDMKMDKALSRIHCPVLFVQGSGDPLVPPLHAKKLYDHVQSEKRLEIIQGADHSYSCEEHLLKLVNMSAEWLNRYL